MQICDTCLRGAPNLQIGNIFNCFFSSALIGKSAQKGVVRQISTFSRPYAPITYAHVCTCARVDNVHTHVCTCVKNSRYARLGAKAPKDHRAILLRLRRRRIGGPRTSKKGGLPTYSHVHMCTRSTTRTREDATARAFGTRLGLRPRGEGHSMAPSGPCHPLGGVTKATARPSWPSGPRKAWKEHRGRRDIILPSGEDDGHRRWLVASADVSSCAVVQTYANPCPRGPYAGPQGPALVAYVPKRRNRVLN